MYDESNALSSLISISVSAVGAPFVILIAVRPEHPLKQGSPIDVTVLGIETIFKASQSLKADDLIAVTSDEPFGS